VTASSPLPEPPMADPSQALMLQAFAAGAGATHFAGGCGAVRSCRSVAAYDERTTVSSSFIAMLPNVSRMSSGRRDGSALPLGPRD